MLFDFSARTEVYFRKGVVASRPDHFKRSLRFKGFLNFAICDSASDVMQKNQDSSSLFEDKNIIPHTPMGLLSWFKGSKMNVELQILEC